MRSSDQKIESVEVSAYTVPTEGPSGDGTRRWDKETLVVVKVKCGSVVGIGHNFADTSTAHFIREHLTPVVKGRNPLNVNECFVAMDGVVRDVNGNSGLSQLAISTVDAALWDLKARLLDLPLCDLLGSVREAAPGYGSGGYVTYDRKQLQDQCHAWMDQGFHWIKMKIGWHPEIDLQRVRWAREALAPDVQIMIDANGAYARKQALGFAEQVRDLGVTWFEEPVPSDDLDGLRLMRDRAPAGMEIAAGEYGDRLAYYRKMLEADAVDVLQADAGRCGGITVFMGVDVLCQARRMPFSAHCVPALHVHPACAAIRLRHMEYFRDHARVEQMLLDGVIAPKDGLLHPDRTRQGNGLSLKEADAERYRVA
jgi:L-alanine-DL-glutamate epimerase-like enolase superfamily enzyme